MLETLTIRNFGIIESVTIDLSQGLNILTGETGAGKSILIDALRFALGERFQSSHLRDGAPQCVVEAVFRLDTRFVKSLGPLEDFPADDDTVVIQRTVTSDGKNKIKINGLVATVAQLKEIGDRLIDFHGPHDHQLLLSSHMHQTILDALTDFGTAQKAYSSTWAQYVEIKKKIQALEELSTSRERDIELLTHQVKELEQVPLDQSYLDQIEADRVKINNAEKLFEQIDLALGILDNDDAGVDSTISRVFKPLNQLATIDPNAEAFLNRLSSIQDSCRELTSELKDYASSLNFNANEARRINDESDAFHEIRRKFGPTLEEAKAFYEDAKRKLEILSDFEHNSDTLQKELRDTEKVLAKEASLLTDKRKKTASLLKKTIEEELKELGFKTVSFEAKVSKSDFGPLGHDEVLFYISPNVGESLKPLSEIVSSGESARIMLAIKKALMKVDPVPVLIFDEIDAQIGGRLGSVIGTKLKEISAHRQVILITHLPQIAAFADTHFKIMKTVDKGRTKTCVEPVEGDARLKELAHMMSGDAMTAVSMKHAEELLSQNNRGKPAKPVKSAKVKSRI